ncbi:glucuronate isomerase [Budvicia aquatica]|uniref:Uronate isomerase n=1 Tax=Budvicia aquatica TaxID=82979 RepID=A0A2C6DKH2_9GAMM|nr:glucuronate isomerase [Budvicia aquatica]PHI29331.1 glucuronate isomerase [Budvicia aquatica]VFS47565.1 Uronate isomerase [Budvicia aquatica]
MKPFMNDSFLLSTSAAERLYFDYAAPQPIFDYHCHLPPKDVAENRQFNNLAEIWLAGDHYKWRVLRTAGVDEQLITGNADDYDKYLAWAAVVPKTLGNPIYHWTHLELRRPFGIENIQFGPQNAEKVWHQANELLATPEFSARGIMQQMNVKMVGTTDDPIDSLVHHQAIAKDASFDIQVRPSWRPDRAFKIDLPGFTDYLPLLEKAADVSISGFNDLLSALAKRLDHFAQHGCVAADHGIEVIRYAPVPATAELDLILQKRRAQQPLSELEIAQFSTAVQVWLGREYAKRGWVMQLHLGALRNNNQRMFKLLGADAGFDSIGDRPVAEALSQLLNALDIDNQLPKTILYCLNPRDNEVLATMCGNFQGGGIAGKVQFGSGWWFNDQKDGMQRQIMQLSQMGLLSQFVGMLTDSRSFLSYTRHEYFRRILCEMVGKWMDDGELPHDFELVGQMVADICYGNASRYFAN